MSTDYKAMLESTSNHQPTVSSPACTALLCCPFCGGDAKLDNGEPSQIHNAQVYCTVCNSSADTVWLDVQDEYFSTKKKVDSEAIKLWNKRAT